MQLSLLISLLPFALASSGVQEERSNLIITYGPPASGKSDAYKMWKGKSGSKLEQHTEIIVDDLVAEQVYYLLPAFILSYQLRFHTRYRDLRNQDLVEKCYASNANMASDECKEFREAENEFCTVAANNYFSNRHVANLKSDSLLLGCLVNDQPENVIYETTGSDGAYGWLLKVAKLAKQAGMKVHLVYPLVSLPKLKKRALARAMQSGRLPCSGAVEAIHGQAAANFGKILKDPKNLDLFDSVLLADNDADVKGAMKEIVFYQKGVMPSIPCQKVASIAPGICTASAQD